jgi:YD repeat-containing protein
MTNQNSAYDANGNTLTDANGNTLTDANGGSYTWNFENRLTQAVVPGAGTVAFKYDPFGPRIRKSSHPRNHQLPL